MKTTIDLPEGLYRQAKNLAIKRGSTLNDLIVRALIYKIQSPPPPLAPVSSAWARRQILPDYDQLVNTGLFSGGRDSTELLGDDRDAR